MRHTSILIILICTLLLFADHALANTVLTVTTVRDSNDGVCDQHCSLREALAAAVDRDFIRFAPALAGATIKLTAPLNFTKGVTIDGPNAAPITLKGDNTFRIIEVDTPSLAISIIFDSLVITGGNAGDEADGGGIYFIGNQGSGINLLNCTVIGNNARKGGGIYVFRTNTLLLTNTTISNNSSVSGGAGIDSTYNNIRAINVTVSNNAASSTTERAVGGINSLNGTVHIFNSTIFNNSSVSSESYSTGGMLELGPRPGAIFDSIIAGNRGLHPDFRGVAVPTRFNLIGNYDGAAFDNPDAGNIVGRSSSPIDPLLDVLRDNGGRVPTHALLGGSLAINGGSNEFNSAPLDARSYQRIVDDRIDIGAFESNAVSDVALMSVEGTVTTTSFRRIGGALIKLTSENGEVRYTRTNPFGHYSFTDLRKYETYTYEVTHKKYVFAPYTTVLQFFKDFVVPD